MQGSDLIVVFFTAVVLSFVGLAHPADSAEPEAFRVGEVEVWAIADNTGERDMSVFIADPEVVRQYAPTGKSPAGVLCFLLRSEG